MAGIAAVFHRTDELAAAQDLAQVTPYLGRERRGQAIARGPCVLIDTSGDVAEADGWMLVATGRLHGAARLATALGQPADAGTAAVLAVAWARWSDRLWQYCQGAFSFVAWHPTARRLVCARDATGVHPLYVHAAPSRVVVASELRAVLEHPEVPRRPNEGMIAELLCVNVESVTETLYASIERVPPGGFTTYGMRGERTTRWWHPAVRDALHGSPSHWRTRARETLGGVVAEAVDGTPHIGTHLSGGFDSSTVTVLAQAARPHGTPLTALANTYPGRSCDERPFIEAVAQHAGIAVVEVEEPAFTADAFLSSVARTRDLPNYPGELASAALRRAAQAHGVDGLLTGYGGDEVSFPATTQRATWWLRGRLHDLVAQFDQDRTRRGRRPALAALLRGAQRALPAAIGSWADEGSSIPSWVRPAWCASVHLEDRLRPPVPTCRSPSKWALLRGIRGGWNVHGREMEAREANTHSLRQEHPLLSREVLELVLEMPEHLRTTPRSPRALYEAAAGNLLPNAVRRRRDKASFDHVLREGMQAMGGLGRWPRLRLAEAGWVDEAVVRDAYGRFMADATGSAPSAFGLWMVFALELWVREAAPL